MHKLQSLVEDQETEICVIKLKLEQIRDTKFTFAEIKAETKINKPGVTGKIQMLFIESVRENGMPK